MSMSRKVKRKVVAKWGCNENEAVMPRVRQNVPVEVGPADESYFERAGFVVPPKSGSTRAAPRNVAGELDKALKECQRLFRLNAGLVASENRLMAENERLRERVAIMEGE
jgi:hypothetical protein